VKNRKAALCSAVGNARFVVGCVQPDSGPFLCPYSVPAEAGILWKSVCL